jgi:peptidoglycan hydrolase-like protein with peptidoglycan-binding domain
MANTILRQGSKGPLVLILQKFLNLKGKLSKPVPETSEFDAETKEGVRAFQKRSGLTVDGTVGAETAIALAKLVGPSAGAFSKAFGPPPEEDDKKDDKPKEELITITLKGKAGTMTKAEFADFQKQAREAIRGTLQAAKQQAVQARSLWDHFQGMNSEGGIDGVVAWCVSLTGPELPDGGLIVDAEAAVKKLESALNGTDFDKIAGALQTLTEPVNKAAKAMWEYQKAVVGSSGNWVTGLEVTRDVSFEVAKAIAKFESGGSPGASKAIDTAAEAIKSIAGEAGKAVAGTSGGLGSAMKNVATDTVIAGIMSLLMGEGSKGKHVVETIEKSLAARLSKSGCQWIANRPALQKFIAAWVSKYLAANASTIAKETMKYATSDMTFDQLADNVAKGLVTSFPLCGLDSFVDQKFAKSTLEQMKKFPNFLKELKAQKISAIDEKVALDILKKELLSGGASKGVEKALDAVLSAATGNVSADQIGKDAVDEFSKSAEFKALCDKVIKQMK